MKTTFSIIIPVYRSEDCLAELCKRINDSLAGYQYQLILINDASPDNSWNMITSLSQVYHQIVGISLRRNSGQDNAIMAGLRYAKSDYVVIMDDDLQHAPEDILTLYEECKKGFDVCYASFPKKQQKRWKNIGSTINGIVSEKTLSKPAEIYLSPFKIFTAELVPELLNYTGPYPYIDALLLSVTANITQVPVAHHQRFKGKGNFNLKRSIAVFLKHTTGYSIYPLRLVLYTGFASIVFSFLLIIFFIIDFFRTGEKVEGWITTVLIILFFGGITLVSLGLIGEYVGRIFMTINRKPQYTINRIIRSNDETISNV